MSARSEENPSRTVGATWENKSGPEVRQHLQPGPDRHNLDERP